MKIEELYHCFLQCDGISTDTRNIKPNSLFFALKGDNFDANSFAEEALKKGASFVIIDDKTKLSNPDKMFLVPDSLTTLQHLALYHRQQLGLPIIAITGSNGKTTSKELIHAVLSTKYNTKATIGNLNNHIGVPLTLLSFDETTDIGIVEMGANHQGEIADLCEIATPDFGYITNFGRAHLEGFGGFEGVIKGKSELYNYLEDNHKMAFVNTDDPRQDAKTITFSRYTFGLESTNDFIIEKYTAQPNASVALKENTVNSNLTGLYNATNIAAALTIGNYFGITSQVAKETIENYIPNNNRSQWLTIESIDILLDAYNANPSSMEASISNFIQLKSDKNKILILGDMFELGQESAKEHQSLIENLKKTNNFQVYFIGKEFYKLRTQNTEENLSFYEDYSAFVDAFTQTNLPKNSQILIKGSRGMALERTLELFK